MEYDVDGIMGLGRSEPFRTGELEKLGLNRGPSIIDNMLDNGLISETTFSIGMSSNRDNKEEGHINFGPVKQESNYDPESLTYIELIDDLFWSTYTTGYAFDYIRNSYRVPDSEYIPEHQGQVYTVFDSDSELILLPNNIFRPYMDAFYA
jgi:hypothetical protein